jgi:hypothetical protein
MRKTKQKKSNAIDTDIISMVKCVMMYPAAAVLGGFVGGMVPTLTWWISHYEVTHIFEPKSLIVAGGMIFSMSTVYSFGKATFDYPWKAIGFVAAMEGVMVAISGKPAIVALVMLIVINAITTGCTIALRHEATRRKQRAVDHRAQTRAENRAQRWATEASRAKPASSVPPVSRVQSPIEGIFTRPSRNPVQRLLT